ILPSNFASDRVFTRIFSSMPRATDRALRLAVRFMTARAPPRLWKYRSLSVADAIFAACMSAEQGSFTSITSPSLRIFSMNSRIVTTPASGNRMIDAKMIEHPADHHIYKIVHGFWTVIEPGAGRHDGRPGF